MIKKEAVFDELLVLKVQDGDAKAFGLIVNRWNKRLISFAYKIVHDVDVAKDVVQDTWVAAYKNMAKLNDAGKFSSWIFRLTHNKAIDVIRKQQLKTSEIKTDMAEEEVEDDPWKTVEHQLKILPADQKLILTLFYLEQQSLKRIADILKLPIGTVKSRLFYARENLKRKYKEVKYEKDK